MADGSARALTDLFSRWTPRRIGMPIGALASRSADTAVLDQVCPTKAFPKFLTCLTSRPSPVLLDLGPVVGSNVTFFGERLGCKIFVEDIFADIERFTRGDRLPELPGFLQTRIKQPTASVDGILCWDLFDYLDRPAAAMLARELVRVLAPTGAVLGFFATTPSPALHFTKFVIVDESQLQHRMYPSSRRRQPAWLTRDVLRLFDGLTVSDSYLLKINTREMLFRKPAGVGAPRGPL